MTVDQRGLRVALIHPMIRTKQPPQHPPYGLLQLAAITDEMGYNVALYDNNAFRLPVDSMREELKAEVAKYGRFAIIGISGLTTQYKFIKEMLPPLRNDWPDALIVAGGGFLTAQPFEMMHWLPQIDIGVIGEAYRTWREILTHVDEEDKDWSHIKGLVYRDGQKIKMSPMRPLIPEEELDDEIPFPAYEFAPYQTYIMYSSIPYAPELMPQPNYMPRRLDALTSYGCPWQCTFCFTPETALMTDGGLVSIHDVVINRSRNSIWTPDGWQKPSQYHEREYHGTMLDIYVAKISEPLSATPEHEIYVWQHPHGRNNRNVKQWKDGATVKKQASQLHVHHTNDKTKKTGQRTNGNYSDKILVPLFPINDRQEIQLPDPSLRSRVRLPKKLPLNNDLLTLLGFYVAEGSISVSDNRPNSKTCVWSFGRHEKSLITKTANILRHLGLTPHLSDTGTSIQVYVGCVQLADFLYSNFGNGAHEKRLPLWLVELSNEKLETFVSACVAGDGHTSSLRTEYTSVSRTLAYQLFLVTARLGYLPSIRKDKQPISVINGRIIKSNYIPWRILWTHSCHASMTGSIIQNCYVLPIRRIISRTYNGKVYNLGFDHPNHRYTANLIAVGNCFHNGCTPYCQSKIYGKPVKGKPIRHHSPEYVVQFMRELRLNYCINFISFLDENLTADRPWFDRFMEELEQSGLHNLEVEPIRWGMVVHSRTVDKAMLERAKQLGCRYISYGGESSSQKLLDAMKKGQTKAQMVAAIDATQAAGMNAIMSFIIGFPETTIDDVIEDCRFYIDRQIHADEPFFLQPYPGSELYAKHKDEIIRQYMTKEEKAFIDKPSLGTFMKYFNHQVAPALAKEPMLPSAAYLRKQTPKIVGDIRDNALERWVLDLDDATKLSVNLTKFNDVELAGLRYMLGHWELRRLEEFKKILEEGKVTGVLSASEVENDGG